MGLMVGSGGTGVVGGMGGLTRREKMLGNNLAIVWPQRTGAPGAVV